jgi:hypothetical protein
MIYILHNVKESASFCSILPYYSQHQKKIRIVINVFCENSTLKLITVYTHVFICRFAGYMELG